MEQRIARMQDLVRAVREVRNRYTVDSRTALDVFIQCNENVAGDFRAMAPFITLLAGVGRLECGASVRKPKHSATHVHAEFSAYVSLTGLIDVDAEIKRLEKQLADKRKHLQGVQTKLDNPNFTGKAPADVVQQQQELVQDLKGQIAALENNIRELRQD
jgi:valyl-tRNA synthetase